jgi:hypothetical protein
VGGDGALGKGIMGTPYLIPVSELVGIKCFAPKILNGYFICIDMYLRK